MAINDPELNGSDWFDSNAPESPSGTPVPGTYPAYPGAGYHWDPNNPGYYPDSDASAPTTSVTNPGQLVPTAAPQQTALTSSGGSGGYSGGGSFGGSAPRLPNLSDFASPTPPAPWQESFNAPTAEQAINSPGFQFRLGEGVKALQRSAAAKGTLLTGGTLKGLEQYAQGEASGEYEKVYNRAFDEYENRRTNFLNNEATRYNAQRGNLQDQWGINSDYFNMGRANRLDDFNIFDTGRKFDFGVSDTNRNFNRMLNQDYYSNMLNLALLGRPPAPGVV